MKKTFLVLGAVIPFLVVPAAFAIGFESLSIRYPTGPVGPATMNRAVVQPAHENQKFSHGSRGIVSSFIQNRGKLGLADDQVSRLKTIRQKFRKTSALIRADLETAYEQFHDEMQNDDINLTQVEGISKQIETLESKQRIEFARAISNGKKVLSKVQLNKAKALRKKSMKPMKPMKPTRS